MSQKVVKEAAKWTWEVTMSCGVWDALWYISSTVEPLNKGHFGSRGFVLFSEVVLWWEVQANWSFIDLIYLDNM